MKHNKIARLCFSVILTAAMLLPSCGGETPAPAENSSGMVSQNASDTPSDVTSEEKPFRSLSDKEAEALFGTGFSQTNGYLDGDYCYFTGSFDNAVTIYRYHYDTGEVEFACKKPGCTHTGEDCPVYHTVHSFSPKGLVCAQNGKVVRLLESQIIGTTSDGEGNEPPEMSDTKLVWYDPQTSGSKVFTLAEGAVRAYLSRAGSSFYCTLPRVYDAGTGRTHPEIWRISEDGEGLTLVMKGGESKDEDLTDADIYPCFVDGKETFIVQSYIGPDGESIYTPNWGQQKVWLYRVESGSEERKLIYDKPVPYVDRINLNMIAGDSVFFADYEPNTTGGSSPKTFHLVNLSTGEDKILAENITDVKLYRLAFTDRCLMWLRDDPTEQYSYILHCYDYLTGEEKEYPLKGDKKRKWREGELFYDRGLLYLVGPNLFDEKGAIYSHTALVVWDIASGAQREIYKGEIVAEVK